MFTDKIYADVGGLMSYGPDIASAFRRAADYVDKVAKGAKPADLPIKQPTSFVFTLNDRPSPQSFTAATYLTDVDWSAWPGQCQCLG
jgi:hypothetical protein